MEPTLTFFECLGLEDSQNANSIYEAIKKAFEKHDLLAFTFLKKKKKKKLYGPFLWMGFNCLKARATSRRQFTFYH